MKIVLTKSKREKLVFWVTAFFLIFGALGIFFGTDFNQLAVYFLSLTGYVGTYIWSETIKKSTDKITTHWPKSNRERMIYISMLIWLVLGVFGIVKGSNLVALASYFASFTPFISAYIIGKTYRPSSQDSKTADEQLILENKG